MNEQEFEGFKKGDRVVCEYGEGTVIDLNISNNDGVYGFLEVAVETDFGLDFFAVKPAQVTRKNEFKNPIGKVGMVATPESMKELQDYLSNFSGKEGVMANTVAFMAWNLASKVIDEALAELEESK